MAPRNGGIVPCSVETCRFPTRTARAKAAQYPFPTRTRKAGGMCHVCHYHALPKVPAAPPRVKVDPDDPPKPETLAAHNAFLADRNARQAARERRQFATTYPHLARSTR